ncbi:hypothetical protein ACGVWS_13175 [Enterobacteriaceae bacterium LUAb1]
MFHFPGFSVALFRDTLSALRCLLFRRRNVRQMLCVFAESPAVTEAQPNRELTKGERSLAAAAVVRLFPLSV